MHKICKKKYAQKVHNFENGFGLATHISDSELLQQSNIFNFFICLLIYANTNLTGCISNTSFCSPVFMSTNFNSILQSAPEIVGFTCDEATSLITKNTHESGLRGSFHCNKKKKFFHFLSEVFSLFSSFKSDVGQS
jgi:hypothetical protein